MLTLYGFGRIFPEGIGETKDLRAVPKLAHRWLTWQRTLGLYAERLRVNVEQIQ